MSSRGRWWVLVATLAGLLPVGAACADEPGPRYRVLFPASGSHARGNPFTGARLTSFGPDASPSPGPPPCTVWGYWTRGADGGGVLALRFGVRDTEVTPQDYVAVRLDPDGDGRSVFEVRINPGGDTWSGLWAEPDEPIDAAAARWTPTLKVKVERFTDPPRWRAEVRLRWPELASHGASRPDGLQEWSVRFVRHEPGAAGFTASSPTGARLVFEARPRTVVEASVLAVLRYGATVSAPLADTRPETTPPEAPPQPPPVQTRRVRVRSGPGRVDESCQTPQVRSVVLRRRSGLGRCFNELLAAGAGAGARLTWRISDAGRPYDVAVEDASAEDPEWRRCLVRQVRRWRFPSASADGGCGVRWSFVFEAR